MYLSAASVRCGAPAIHKYKNGIYYGFWRKFYIELFSFICYNYISKIITGV